MSKGPLQYHNGKLAVVVEENESIAPPYGRTTVAFCDAAGSSGILGGLRLPPSLATRDKLRLNAPGGVLLPVALMPNGDIIATSSVIYGDTMDILRYRGPDIASILGPDASSKLQVPADSGYHQIQPLCTAPLDKHGFLMAVYEADCSVLPVQGRCRTSIYALDAEAMTIRWHAEPVGGGLYSVHNITGLDCPRPHDRGTAPARNHSPPYLEDHTGSIVVVFRDGLVYAINLRQFLKDGLPQEHENMAVTESLEERWRVLEADVVGWTVVMLVNVESTGRSISLVAPPSFLNASGARSSVRTRLWLVSAAHLRRSLLDAFDSGKLGR
ncbi:hypothetical protein C8Q72DRAFT_850302 [Fomitopsis betulina]|nr:hypothetical protein C8Q72DRAFT_850302 [Fomitopsis betulina]